MYMYVHVVYLYPYWDRSLHYRMGVINVNHIPSLLMHSSLKGSLRIVSEAPYFDESTFCLQCRMPHIILYICMYSEVARSVLKLCGSNSCMQIPISGLMLMGRKETLNLTLWVHMKCD
jgi:hypothetical protein